MEVTSQNAASTAQNGPAHNTMLDSCVLLLERTSNMHPVLFSAFLQRRADCMLGLASRLCMSTYMQQIEN